MGGNGGGAGQTGLAGGLASSEPFRLLFRDEFDSLSPDRWAFAEHTFEENLADFREESAIVEDGVLRLLIEEKPAEAPGKAYYAAEVRTVEEYRYGKFVVSARFAPGSGIVSTFFSFHDFFRYDGSSNLWDEIVFEGAAPSTLRCSYTTEDETAPGGMRVQSATEEIPFDATEEFHVYSFEWTPEELGFFVDGQMQHRMVLREGALSRDHRVVMSAYPSTLTDLVGTFDPSVLPVHAEYDWVEVYEYTGF